MTIDPAAKDWTQPWEDDEPITDLATNYTDCWLTETVRPNETEIRGEMSGHELIPPIGYSSWGMYEAACDIRGARWNYDDWSDDDIQEKCPKVRALSSRVYLNNLRASKRGLQADLTVVQWIEICHAFNNACAYCNQTGDPYSLAIEHLVPITRGGGTTKSNIVPSCKRCNGKKHAH